MQDPQRPFAAVFSPMELAGRQLRNRIVHASISTMMADRCTVTDKLIRYYANRAQGGAAMIVTEPMGGAPHQVQPSRARAYDDSQLEGLARWAEAVEGAGCRLLGQIQDAGRGRHIPGRNPNAIGASALPDDLSWTVPHVLSAGEAEALIEQFALSSARLARCGFSGVELSAGHGHLFHQFMSPLSNQRTDRYGGDFAGRMRFMDELVAAIRSACGAGFILGVKLPGNDGVPGGIDIETACRIGRHLADSGKVDYFCLAQGSHHRSLELHIPDDHFPRVPFLPLTRAFRRAVPEVPLMALGRITDPAEAEGIVASGDADLVGIGRALITDPAWPLKAQRDRARDIRYCVAGNSCWNRVINHLHLGCDNNPRVAEADEVDWKPPATPARRRVVVVGAGVAGLEAAWIAAARGHAVTVFGRSGEVGGKARLHAALPGSESVSSVYDYQYAAAVKAGVRFELGREASVADVVGLAPDVVILASGSDMIWPAALPERLRDEGWIPDLRGALGDVLRVRQRQPGCAVLLDMDHTEGTYAAAELLHQRFESVVIVTPRESLAQDVPLVTRQGIQRRLFAMGVTVHTLAELQVTDAFESDGEIAVVSVFGGPPRPIPDVSFLSFATPRRPRDDMLEPLRQAGLDVRAVGDCRVAGPLMAATADGNRVGVAL